MSYKMVCIDMDGTLLNSQKKLSEINKTALKKAYDKGVHIIICTGRNTNSARYFSNLIGIKSAAIANNGAIVIDEDGEVLLFKETLNKEQCIRLLELGRKYKATPNFHGIGKIYLNSRLRKIANDLFFNRSVPEKFKIKNVYYKSTSNHWDEVFSNSNEFFGKCIFTESPNKLRELEKELIKGDFEITYSGKYCLEVNNKGVNKGRAVKLLSEHYDIKQEEVICIGDNGNDISMIEFAGLGVAMENGTEAIKKIANYTTTTNDKNGVAKVIEKFILNEE
ncbi:MAG: Cof-type HAD-IIB family hydrolase [Sarcina sp.]